MIKLPALRHLIGFWRNKEGAVAIMVGVLLATGVALYVTFGPAAITQRSTTQGLLRQACVQGGQVYAHSRTEASEQVARQRADVAIAGLLSALTGGGSGATAPTALPSGVTVTYSALRAQEFLGVAPNIALTLPEYDEEGVEIIDSSRIYNSADISYRFPGAGSPADDTVSALVGAGAGGAVDVQVTGYRVRVESRNPTINSNIGENLEGMEELAGKNGLAVECLTGAYSVVEVSEPQDVDQTQMYAIFIYADGRSPNWPNPLEVPLGPAQTLTAGGARNTNPAQILPLASSSISVGKSYGNSAVAQRDGSRQILGQIFGDNIPATCYFGEASTQLQLRIWNTMARFDSSAGGWDFSLPRNFALESQGTRVLDEYASVAKKKYSGDFDTYNVGECDYDFPRSDRSTVDAYDPDNIEQWVAFSFYRGVADSRSADVRQWYSDLTALGPTSTSALSSGDGGEQLRLLASTFDYGHPAQYVCAGSPGDGAIASTITEETILKYMRENRYIAWRASPKFIEQVLAGEHATNFPQLTADLQALGSPPWSEYDLPIGLPNDVARAAAARGLYKKSLAEMLLTNRATGVASSDEIAQVWSPRLGPSPLYMFSGGTPNRYVSLRLLGLNFGDSRTSPSLRATSSRAPGGSRPMTDYYYVDFSPTFYRDSYPSNFASSTQPAQTFSGIWRPSNPQEMYRMFGDTKSEKGGFVTRSYNRFERASASVLSPDRNRPGYGAGDPFKPQYPYFGRPDDPRPSAAHSTFWAMFEDPLFRPPWNAGARGSLLGTRTPWRGLTPRPVGSLPNVTGHGSSFDISRSKYVQMNVWAELWSYDSPSDPTFLVGPKRYLTRYGAAYECTTLQPGRVQSRNVCRVLLLVNPFVYWASPVDAFFTYGNPYDARSRGGSYHRWAEGNAPWGAWQGMLMGWSDQQNKLISLTGEGCIAREGTNFENFPTLTIYSSLKRGSFVLSDFGG